jgi:hypothetical protein
MKKLVIGGLAGPAVTFGIAVAHGDHGGGSPLGGGGT